MPVPIAPIMPPMQWTPNTSSESSYRSLFFTVVTKKKQTTEATAPRMIDVPGAAKPDAGVIATRPATAPVALVSFDKQRVVDGDQRQARSET